MQVYIQQVCEDGKIGLCLTPPGHERISEVADTILAYLSDHGGFMPLTDKTAPEKSMLYSASAKNPTSRQ